MPTMFFVIFFAIVVVLLVGGFFSHRQQQERQQALGHLACQMNWQFDPAKNYELDDTYDAFGIFSRGTSRYGYNTSSGMLTIDNRLWPTVMGDYHYKTTSGTGKQRKTTTHLFSYLIVELPFQTAGSLKIRQEQFYDRVASFIGFDDIDFELAEFSDRFHVKSSNKRFAYDVINPLMMEFLLDRDPPTVHLEAPYCCIFTSSKCWSAPEFRQNAVWMQEFFELWPRHLTSV
ncbi:MAG: hypothetical protein ACR2NM_17840 [Bythopirellula sp.]